MTNEITQRFRAIRAAEGLSQIAMAKIPTLKGWQVYELGKRLPGSEAYITLAEMGYSVDWLLTGKGEMRSNDEGEPINKKAMDTALGVLKSEIQTSQNQAFTFSELCEALQDIYVGILSARQKSKGNTPTKSQAKK